MMQHFLDQRNKLFSPVLLEEMLREPAHFKHPDHYRWIAHTILTRSAFDKRYEWQDGFVPLKCTTLRRMVDHRHLSKVIRALEDWQVIERNHSYTPGRRSMGYRLSNRAIQSGIGCTHVKDRGMNQRLGSQRFETMLDFKGRPAYASVRHWVESMSIDQTAALQLVYEMYSPDIPANRHKHLSRVMGINAIAFRNSFHVVDPRTGRYYHHYACLGKDLRPFVSINGHLLHEVDIGSCQPLLLHLHLRNTHSIDALEASRMADLVIGGDLYSAINTTRLDRDAFKVLFYKHVLFGKDFPNDIMKSFAKEFPCHAAGIRALKQGNHARLAHALQRMEAEIIFDAVGRFVRRVGPEAPIITIHDSLSTFLEYLPTARSVLSETFKDRYGIEPTLRVK